MKVNTKIRYGLRTIIHLAAKDDKSGIFQKDIAEEQNISYKYLDSIIPVLKANGLIRNVGGRGSGYVLSKPAQKITVYDVYSAFENKVSILDCLFESGHCERKPLCTARDFWSKLNLVIDKEMKKTKISDLIYKK